MSAIAGILNPPSVSDGNESLQRLDRALAHLGPDGCRTYSASGGTFLYRRFDTTAEAITEDQPLVVSGIVVTFDGRIDNRPELQEALGTAGLPDVELVLKAYQRWGVSCFGHLEGDFAIAIWNETSRTLILARDPFGVRTLFYYMRGHTFIWASTAGALLSCPGVPADVDDEYVALYLALFPDERVSPFRAIKPVKPSTYLLWKDGKVTSLYYRNIWDNRNEIRLSVDDCAERFRELFLNGVRARMRAREPVTAELSGGLDSSSIVCGADRVSGSDGNFPHVHTLSFVYNAAHLSDEREYISLVENDRRQIGSHIFEDDNLVLSSWPDPSFIEFPAAERCFGPMTKALITDMTRRRSKILLSGLLGDQLLLSSDTLPYYAADLLRTGNLWSSAAFCYDWSVRSRQRFPTTFHAAALRPNLSTRRTNAIDVRIPDWVSHALIRQVDLDARMRDSMRVTASCKMPSNRARHAMWKLGMNPFASGYSENMTTFSCIEMRYPYLHRPLVEFVMSLPITALTAPRQTRILQRNAMKSLLPESIRLRTDKRGPTSAVLIAIGREWPNILNLLQKSEAVGRGYVDSTIILNELQRARHGHAINVSQVLRFLSLESWLRSLAAWMPR